MARKRSFRDRPAPARPWTQDEDDKIVEVTRIGLSSHLWDEAIPGRAFGEILERRMTLQEQGLCPKTKLI